MSNAGPTAHPTVRASAAPLAPSLELSLRHLSLAELLRLASREVTS